MSRSTPRRVHPVLGHVIVVIAAACLAVLTPQAMAQTQVFTTNTTISDTDFTYEGFDIIVRGATLTINGVHSFNSLTVERNASNQPGVVTHSAGFENREVAGMWLTIAEDVFVEGVDESLVGSRVDCSGKGFASATGPGAGGSAAQAGGGGHGGAGGGANGANGLSAGLGGGTDGDFSQPLTMGSGGGADNGGGGQGPGGSGGGVLRLQIAGILTVDGSVMANGASAGGEAGGGAGGSIWISCGGLHGTGTVTANGGNGNVSWSGGGGGGRIAITVDTLTLPLSAIQAKGGNGWRLGGAGTVWLDVAAAPRPVLHVDNGGFIGGLTAVSGTVEIPGDVVIAGAARFGPQQGDATLHLVIEGDIDVLEGASLFANGAGYSGGTGPSTGGPGFQGGGGGHGGAGGGANGANGLPAGLGGGTDGDFSQPVTMGSGGGNDSGGSSGSAPGGAGGGVLRITAGGSVTVDGSIAANGNNLGANEAGGGAGGSIWISCGGLHGTGTVTANGGNGNVSWSGGGGGGRIAIYSCAIEMPLENIMANGGTGWQSGGVGSVGIFSDTIDFISLPQPVTVDPGDVAVFVVSATGEGEVAYQWFKNNQPLEDGGNISGSTTETLVIVNATCPADAGPYRVRVTDDCGDAFTPAVQLVVFIPGDLNNDCFVNGADLGILLGAWGACEECAADLNGDSVVNGADLGILLGAWTS